MSEKTSAQGGHAQVTRLGTGNIKKLLLEFAIPAIVGVLVNGIYNLISSVFLGQAMGEVGLAAMTVAMPSTIVLMSFGQLIGNGGNTLAAIRLGQGKHRDAEKCLANCMTLLFITGILIALVGLFALEPLLMLSGATPEVLPYSKLYMQILCMGFIFQGVGMGINNFIRTAGAPKRALLSMVIGAVVCVFFNYFFVMVFAWGIPGSAAATLMGQFASCVSVLWYFISPKSKAPFRLHRVYLKIDTRLAKMILSLGLAPFALNAASAIVNIVLNNQLALYGGLSIYGAEAALAAVGVVGKVSFFGILPVMGLVMAAQPIIGFNYGARNYRRVQETVKIAIIWATAFAIFFFALCRIIPGPIILLFGIDGSLLDFAIQALAVYMLFTPAVGSQIVMANYFQATGQPLKAAILSLSRQVLYLIPLMIWLPTVLPDVLPQVDSLTAICFAAPGSDFLAFITTITFFIFEMKRINRLKEQQDEDIRRRAALSFEELALMKEQLTKDEVEQQKKNRRAKAERIIARK